MMPNVYAIIDIETVENGRAKELFATKVYEHDGRLKDPEKIEQNVREKRQKDMETAALYWWTGKVICICANVMGLDEKPKTFVGDDERELLSQFFDWLLALQTRTNDLTIIAKSGEYFDQPYLIGRALALDLGVPGPLRPSRPVKDIDHIFSFSTQCGQRSSLTNYAFGLSIPGKTAHGSDVAGMYCQIQMGDDTKWKVIADYCARDTDIATEILKRYLKPYVSRHAPKAEPLPIEDIPFKD